MRVHAAVRKHVAMLVDDRPPAPISIESLR